MLDMLKQKFSYHYLDVVFALTLCGYSLDVNIDILYSIVLIHLNSMFVYLCACFFFFFFIWVDLGPKFFHIILGLSLHMQSLPVVHHWTALSEYAAHLEIVICIPSGSAEKVKGAVVELVQLLEPM